MPLVAAKCTNCGAPLQVDSSKEAAVCQYCGTPFITEKAINYYNTTNNINANVVNIFGGNSSDFEIKAGVLIKYTGASTDVVIPDTVKKIGREAFKLLEGLTSVTIPDGVTEIGDEAFRYCRSLTSVTIPESVTRIGASAFDTCLSLTSVKIPESVTRIGASAFKSCYSLTSVKISDNVTSIESRTFEGCGLTSLTIPNSVTEIGDEAFSFCSLTSVTIPASVTLIYSGAFQYCGSLETVTVLGNPEFYNGIYKIDDYPFLGCSKLTQFNASDVWIQANSKYLITQKPTVKSCYVATCVYGSYDCPQVWTLRRFRDYSLAETWYGRAFIRTYYAISPTIVKWFGNTNWFKKLWRGRLDRMVKNLNAKGVKDTPYQDRTW